MLGNDLIDLRQAELDSNWQRKGYLEKIFNAEERSKVHLAENQAVMVWLLWSMKEAAYKIVNRASKNRFYRPVSFECYNVVSNKVQATGLIKYEGNTYVTKSNISLDFIHTIAIPYTSDSEKIQTHYYDYKPDYVDRFNNHQSIYYLSRDDSGLPEIINREQRSVHITSISHHGKYLAIIFI